MRPARLLAPFVLALAPCLATAQPKGPTDDSVVLKNGTMVTGKILDDDPQNGITIKLANGKVRVIPASEIKMVDRAATANEKPKPEPKPKRDEPVEPEKKDDDEAKKKPEADAGCALHEGTKIGVGLDLGLVLSRSNSAGDLKLLSPQIGAHLAIDVGLARKVYLRIDPGLATFSRSSEVPGVPMQFDASVTPGVLTTRTVATKLRIVELLARVEVGYDFTDTITSRIGAVGGLTFTAASGDVCDSSTDLGAAYGLSVKPVAARFGESRAVEVALAIDYLSVPVKRCTTSVPDGFVPPAGAISVFQPLFAKDRIGVGVVGLGVTYML
jgi:hypothetical protein